MINIADSHVVDLLSALLVPYSFGAGTPADGLTSWPGGARGLHGGVGWDCSGFAQAALVRLGLLSPKAPDRSAAALWDGAEPVDPDVPGQYLLGELAFYGASGRISHVMVCLGGNAVIGASGGVPTTNGDDPRAFVQVRPLGYRVDFRGVRRLRA